MPSRAAASTPWSAIRPVKLKSFRSVHGNMSAFLARSPARGGRNPSTQPDNSTFALSSSRRHSRSSTRTEKLANRAPPLPCRRSDRRRPEPLRGEVVLGRGGLGSHRAAAPVGRGAEPCDRTASRRAPAASSISGLRAEIVASAFANSARFREGLRRRRFGFRGAHLGRRKSGAQGVDLARVGGPCHDYGLSGFAKALERERQRWPVGLSGGGRPPSMPRVPPVDAFEQVAVVPRTRAPAGRGAPARSCPSAFPATDELWRCLPSVLAASSTDNEASKHAQSADNVNRPGFTGG